MPSKRSSSTKPKDTAGYSSRATTTASRVIASSVQPTGYSSRAIRSHTQALASTQQKRHSSSTQQAKPLTSAHQTKHSSSTQQPKPSSPAQYTSQPSRSITTRSTVSFSTLPSRPSSSTSRTGSSSRPTQLHSILSRSGYSSSAAVSRTIIPSRSDDPTKPKANRNGWVVVYKLATKKWYKMRFSKLSEEVETDFCKLESTETVKIAIPSNFCNERGTWKQMKLPGHIKRAKMRGEGYNWIFLDREKAGRDNYKKEDEIF
ncbi:hypothetical protein BDZ45DRAFT_237402 [Acephala macrosclerotiorum]|nr:hypothetical protein BDZ45DRAFT_237402 [Acephala macrosclerotiorum]